MRDAETIEEIGLPSGTALCSQVSSRVKRMKFPNAVKAELGKWRLSAEEKAMVMMFCVCVGMRMSGEDVEAFVSNPGHSKVVT